MAVVCSIILFIMLFRTVFNDSSIFCTDSSFVGDSLERDIERMVVDKTPIESVAPMLYTERKDGVLPEYDIRTDRWQIAQEAMTNIAKSNLAKRMARLNKDNDVSPSSELA